jgi:outer membrane protein OmpA-like peptidoglycan-associated protein
MSTSTLDLLTGLLTPDMLRTAAKATGETDSGIAKALGAAFPAILGQMVQGANNSTLMGNIVEMAKTPAVGALLGPGGGVLSTVGSLLTLGAAGSSPLTSIATGLLSALFGNRIGDIGKAIGSLAGLKHAGSAGSLLGLAAPMVLAALGNRLGSGLTGTALAVLLGQEKAGIMKAIPGALTGAMGLIGGGTAAGAAAATAAPAAAARVAHSAPAAAAAAAAAYDDEPRGGSFLGSVLGLIITGAVIAGLVFGISQCRRATETAVAPAAPAPAAKVAEPVKAAPAPAKVAEPAKVAPAPVAAKPVEAPKPAPAPVAAAPTPPPAAPAPAPAAPAAAAKIASLLAGLKPGEGGLMSLALPTGKTIQMAEKGVESALIGFLEDASRPIDKGTWFDFDRLSFKTASSDLTPESRSQVEAVAEIMKAFPTSEVKIGGYTDNVGNPENNLKLSDTRAKAVATELIALGIPAARLDAEGYGEQHAVADNATPEGRARNRRTALSVRKR